MKDTYRTIAAATAPVLFKEKQSKFLGYAFPVKTEAEVKTYLENLDEAKKRNEEYLPLNSLIAKLGISYGANRRMIKEAVETLTGQLCTINDKNEIVKV